MGDTIDGVEALGCEQRDLSLWSMSRAQPAGVPARAEGAQTKRKRVSGTSRNGTCLRAQRSTAGLRAALVIAGLPLPVLMASTGARVRRSDAFAVGRGAAVARLHRVPLFHGLDMASLEQLATFAQHEVVAAGSEPVRQVEEGRCFFVIGSGG